MTDHTHYSEMLARAKCPIKYACPLIYHSPHLRQLQNATISLLQIDGLFLGVTNLHVLDGYEQACTNSTDVVFRLGNLVIDRPLTLEVSRNKDLDLVVFDLTNADRNQIPDKDNTVETDFYSPPIWPPSEVQEGDFLMLGGFPGEYRQKSAPGELSIGSFSSGASEVVSVSDRHYCVKITGTARKHIIVIQKNPLIKNLGGISGGPAFRWQNGESMPEYVGTIYEHNSNYGLLFIAKSMYMDKAGKIRYPI